MRKWDVQCWNTLTECTEHSTPTSHWPLSFHCISFFFFHSLMMFPLHLLCMLRPHKWFFCVRCGKKACKSSADQNTSKPTCENSDLFSIFDEALWGKQGKLCVVSGFLQLERCPLISVSLSQFGRTYQAGFYQHGVSCFSSSCWPDTGLTVFPIMVACSLLALGARWQPCP